MKIPKDYDVVGKEAPAFNKGTSPFENPQIEPSLGPIKDTPGENASNSTAPESMNKAQPFKKKGSGYTG